METMSESRTPRALEDPSGRRFRRMRWLGRIVATLFLVWFAAIVLGALGGGPGRAKVRRRSSPAFGHFRPGSAVGPRWRRDGGTVARAAAGPRTTATTTTRRRGRVVGNTR